MVDYGYTGMSRTPNTFYVCDEVSSSSMENKSVQNCTYSTKLSMLTVSFSETGLNPSDETILDGIVEDSYTLPGVKYSRINYVKNQAENVVNKRYTDRDQRSLSSMYSDGLRIRPNQQYYTQPYLDWVREIDEEVKSKIDDIYSASTIPEVEAISLSETGLIALDPGITPETGLNVTDDLTLDTFLDANVAVTGMAGETGILGPYYLIELLNHRKELYNDNENPLYIEGHTPILGESGMLTDHANRISTEETIHAKGGWHRQDVTKANYSRPKDMLIYYGYLNSFNSAVHSWNNEEVAKDMSRYQILVFGDGVQDPSHPDYANTQIIIPRIKALRPDALIFGYVSTNQSLANFQTKTNQWETLQVHGIFMDESGYDHGRTRAEFNDRVDFVHSKTYANIAFANAWNTDNILGTANDPSYPNSTYNPSAVESNLDSDDWVLLESFAINTTSYSGTDGFEPKAQWASRGSKFQGLRSTYNVNFAAVGIINNDNANGTTLFNFGFISSLMWALEGFGTSDTSYASGTAKVDYWTRPTTNNLGRVWNLNASVQVDNNDSDQYHRYVELARLTLDFSSGGETGSITIY